MGERTERGSIRWVSSRSRLHPCLHDVQWEGGDPAGDTCGATGKEGGPPRHGGELSLDFLGQRSMVNQPISRVTPSKCPGDQLVLQWFSAQCHWGTQMTYHAKVSAVA
jgi:hypothetical protein